jgi:hypothetical protein
MWLHVSGHMLLDCLRRYRSFEDLTSLLPSPLGASSKLNSGELRYGEVRRKSIPRTSVNKVAKSPCGYTGAVLWRPTREGTPL